MVHCGSGRVGLAGRVEMGNRERNESDGRDLPGGIAHCMCVPS